MIGFSVASSYGFYFFFFYAALELVEVPIQSADYLGKVIHLHSVVVVCFVLFLNTNRIIREKEESLVNLTILAKVVCFQSLNTPAETS